MKTTKPPNPWDLARKIEVIRGNDLYPPEALDPGVRFFVLMLEQGAARRSFPAKDIPPASTSRSTVGLQLQDGSCDAGS